MRLKWMLRVYFQYMRISFNAAAAYRANFFFIVLISLLSNLLIPIFTVLLYSSGSIIPGWSFHEALLIQSVFMLCCGICAPFFSNMVWIVMYHVREGTYDLFMLKPGSTVFITAASSFDFENIGPLVGGIGMFIYAICHLPPVGMQSVVQFAFLFIMGVCMMLGCTLIMTATAFKWVGNSRIYEIFDAVTTFGRYPGIIFSKILRGITTYAIPVAMLGFFPASAILGRSDYRMFIACVPCICFLLSGIAVFRAMIYSYQSAGG